MEWWVDLNFARRWRWNENGRGNGVLGEVEFLDKRVLKLSTSVSM